MKIAGPEPWSVGRGVGAVKKRIFAFAVVMSSEVGNARTLKVLGSSGTRLFNFTVHRESRVLRKSRFADSPVVRTGRRKG